MTLASRKQLSRLANWHIAGVAIVFVLSTTQPSSVINNPTTGLTFLSIYLFGVMMIEGGFYWLIKSRPPTKKSIHRTNRRNLILRFFLSFVYLTNIGLLILFPVLTIVFVVSRPLELDTLLGMLFYLFSLVTFVHYFIFKMFKSPTDQMVQGKRFVRARLLRELQRS